jgi:hypothetical protein
MSHSSQDRRPVLIWTSRRRAPITSPFGGNASTTFCSRHARHHCIKGAGADDPPRGTDPVYRGWLDALCFQFAQAFSCRYESGRQDAHAHNAGPVRPDRGLLAWTSLPDKGRGSPRPSTLEGTERSLPASYAFCAARQWSVPCWPPMPGDCMPDETIGRPSLHALRQGNVQPTCAPSLRSPRSEQQPGSSVIG